MSEQRTEHSEQVTDETVAVSDTTDTTEATVAAETTESRTPDASPTDTAGAESATDETESTHDTDDTEGDADGGNAGDGSRRGGRRAQLVREGEVAADFLETLLDICDLDGDLDVDVDGDRAAVAIVDSEDGRVPRRLVGPDGQVLDALQELARLAVQSETGERSRLMLDVAGHRAERRAALVAIAKEAITKVKDSGESTSLSPMSAFERKVVHDEVLAAGLVSESEGSEPRRYVVIAPSA
jgi:spoIIIJ-associated protein